MSGLQFAYQVCFRRLLGASNSSNAIQACTGMIVFSGYLGIVIQEILGVATFFFMKSSFFTRRGNVVVHELAKWCSHVNYECIFMDEVPAPIIPWVVNDICP